MFKGGMAQMMQQAQKMQEEMKKAQKKLEKMEITGSAGADLVKVTITGKHEAKKVEIDDSVMDDKEMLEDLITAAINSAVQKLSEQNSEQMKGLTEGLNLPGNFKLPL